MEILETVEVVLYVVMGTVFFVIVAIVVIAAGVFALAGIISAFVSFVTMLYRYFKY